MTGESTGTGMGPATEKASHMDEATIEDSWANEGNIRLRAILRDGSVAMQIYKVSQGSNFEVVEELIAECHLGGRRALRLADGIIKALRKDVA